MSRQPEDNPAGRPGRNGTCDQRSRALVRRTSPSSGEPPEGGGRVGGGGRQHPPGDNLPIIQIDVDEHRVNDEAVAAVAADPEVFWFGGQLVRVAVREARPAIVPLQKPTLREHLARAAVWVRWDTRTAEWVATSPPGFCVSALHARCEWPGVRPLAGVASHPVLRPDGTVLNRDGYDPATGLFLAGAADLVIPLDPSRAAVESAVSDLCEVVCDFRFGRPSDRAGWVALVLTRLARRAFRGPAPLFLTNGTAAGVGKGKLANAANALVTGEPEIRAMGYVRGDAEMAKKINAFATRGDTLLQFGNVNGTFGSPVLDEALTSGRWGDRIVGGNRVSDVSLDNVLWAANGNHVRLVGDTPRRVLQIDLTTDLERPEERRDFRHPDLVGWVLANRPRLLAAAFTILVGYERAGRPDMGLTPWGSFEGWSALIRSALVWAGLPDPGESRATNKGHRAPEEEAVRAVLARWNMVTGGVPTTVGDLVARVFPRGAGGESVTPTDAEMAGALRAVSESVAVKAIGTVLGKYRDRPLGEWRLVQDGITAGTVRWRVERVAPGNTAA